MVPGSYKRIMIGSFLGRFLMGQWVGCNEIQRFGKLIRGRNFLGGEERENVLILIYKVTNNGV